MLTKTINDALNVQINEEMFSAYYYLAMSAKADSMGLPGFANWFKLQYLEELSHADRFFTYILERDGEVALDAIAKPEIEDEAILGMFEKTFKHEQYITQCIFKLKDLAGGESDHATDVFLEWFVNEQVEEEATSRAIIDQLRMVEGNRSGLFMVDRELAARQADDGE